MEPQSTQRGVAATKSTFPPHPPLSPASGGEGWGEGANNFLYKISRFCTLGVQRKALCPQERRSKGRDIAGWEIDSLVEGEAVLGG